MQRKSYPKHRAKALSYKLKCAVDILKVEYGTVTQIRALIKEKADLELKESEFSKLLGAYRRNDYLTSKDLRKLKKIFEILDPFVKETYNFFWDLNAKQYKEETQDPLDPRLQGLVGTYEGYSWDAETTNMKGEGYIHMFKVKIVNVNKILCATKASTFEGNKIIAIATNRIALEVSNKNRKVFLIAEIGNVPFEDLQKTNSLRFAYTDSGRDRAKAGLAILERTDKEYDNLIPESKPLSTFENSKDPSFITFLRNAQIILEPEL